MLFGRGKIESIILLSCFHEDVGHCPDDTIADRYLDNLYSRHSQESLLGMKTLSIITASSVAIKDHQRRGSDRMLLDPLPWVFWSEDPLLLST